MLSKLDKKILFSLDQDGRKSLSLVAKEVGSSVPVVKYHIEKLLEDGAIKNFWSFVDYNALGYDYFWGYWLKFTGANEEKRTEVFDYLQQHTHIPIVFRCDGFADVMIAIIAKDLFHHNDILNNFLGQFDGFIQVKEISIGVSFSKFNRNYISDHLTSEKVEISGKKPVSRHNIDTLDKKIISLTQKNGRIKFTQMADILDEHPLKIQRHYKKLVSSGIIQSTTYSLSPQKNGVHFFRLLLQIANDKSRVNDLFTFSKQNPHIIHYIKTIGAYQAMVDIEVFSREMLREIIQELYQRFTDLILNIEINEIYAIDKFSQMATEYPDLNERVSLNPWTISGTD